MAKSNKPAKPEGSADKLIKPTKKGEIELSEENLKRLSVAWPSRSPTSTDGRPGQVVGIEVEFGGGTGRKFRRPLPWR